MKKFKNLFVMVMVLVVMVVLTGACKKADVDPVPSIIQITDLDVRNLRKSAGVSASWYGVNNSNANANGWLLVDWGDGRTMSYTSGGLTVVSPGTHQGTTDVFGYFYSNNGTYVVVVKIALNMEDGSVIYSDPKTVTLVIN
jgi:hypothetical protein